MLPDRPIEEGAKEAGPLLDYYRIEQGGRSVGGITFGRGKWMTGLDCFYLRRSRPCGEVRSSAGPTGTIRVGLMSSCVT